MVNTIDDLFVDTELTDITFVIYKEEVLGHRAIFGKACDYFKKLLYGDFKESKSKRVRICGTSAKLFLEVKRFIYLGNLEISNWTMDDLLGLLSLAHEFQYQRLLTEVTKAVEVKPMDFDSWKLVQTAASVYDLQTLRSKGTCFAEDKLELFLRLEDLEKFTSEFICFMFESSKISRVNQDHLLRAICKWKLNRSADEIMPLFEKICWENVSPSILAVLVKEFLSLGKTVVECKCWNHVGTLVEKAFEEYCVRIDDVLLTWKGKEFEVSNYQCLLWCELYPDFVQISFRKDNLHCEIPIKKLEWEVAYRYNFDRVYGLSIYNEEIKMGVLQHTAIENRFKYSANFSKATNVCKIRIFSPLFKFHSYSEERFYNFVIW